MKKGDFSIKHLEIFILNDLYGWKSSLYIAYRYNQLKLKKRLWERIDVNTLNLLKKKQKKRWFVATPLALHPPLLNFRWGANFSPDGEPLRGGEKNVEKGDQKLSLQYPSPPHVEDPAPLSENQKTA